MSAQYGSSYKINRVVKGTPDVYNQLGGTVLDARLDPRISVHEEVGSGEGRQLSSQKVVAAKPMLEWNMNVRRLDDYILPYATITAEGAVPEHTLYVTDGAEHHDLLGKVNTCSIKISQEDSIKAALAFAVKTRAAPSLGTFLYRTDAAMYKDAVTTLTLGGSPVTKWKDIEFSVDNNVLQEVLGTDITPTEVQEQEARYAMRITKARVGASKLPAALAATPQTFVVTLQDAQPVSKTFTFADMTLKTATIEDRELGLIMERIEGSGRSLVVT